MKYNAIIYVWQHFPFAQHLLSTCTLKVFNLAQIFYIYFCTIKFKYTKSKITIYAKTLKNIHLKKRVEVSNKNRKKCGSKIKPYVLLCCTQYLFI